MKLTLTLLAAALFATSAFAQVPAPKTALDKKALEEYLRNVELWVPQVGVTIDDPVPSKYAPGLKEVTVHLSYNGQGKDEIYHISNDGQTIVKGEIFNITKSPFQANLDKLKTDLERSYGTPGAPVVAVVFGDFQCPNCKTEAEAMRKFIPAEFNDKVRVYYKDFPLDAIHPWARAAAITGRCVAKQNPVTFWKFHDWVYSVQGDITTQNLNAKVQEWAGSAGLDGLQLSRCIDNKETEADVNKNIAEGKSLGVDATPTLFLNGRRLVGSLEEGVLRQLLQIELTHQATAPDAGEKCCTVNIPSLAPAGAKK
jgi:protein-disulfide isomerase